MNKIILDKLASHFSSYETRSYAKGKILIFADQEPKGVLWLKEGTVEQYDITPEGNKVIVNIFKPPAFFPMSWAINKTPNTYFYTAFTDVKVKQAPADETVAFLQANPDLLFDLLSRVYRGTDTLLKRLLLAARGIAENRLIYELLIESYRFSKQTDDGKNLINIKQGALAARCGLARETVTRELQKLENNNFIARTKKGIEIDIKKLEEKLDLTV